MKKLKETYFAVMIGNFKEHTPYFMVHKDTVTPQLFLTKQGAKEAVSEDKDRRIVKVVLSQI